MKKTRKPIKKSTKIISRTLTGTFVGALAAVGAFMITPNKTIFVHFDENAFALDDSITADSHLNRFITHLKNVADEENEEHIPGVKLSFEDFNITWGKYSDNSGFKNSIDLAGNIMLGMNSLSDIQFTAELGVNYNSRNIDLGLGYVNKDLYIALQDLRLKSSNINTETMKERLFNLFFNEENPDGLGVKVDVDGMINALLGKVDLNGLMDKLNPADSETSMGFDLYEEEVAENKTNVHIDVYKKDKVTGNKVENGDIVNLVLALFDDEEGITHLDYLDLGTISLDDLTIKGKIRCDSVSNFKLYGFDTPEYLAQGGKNFGEFVEMIDYIGWADKLLNFLQERTLGLSFTAEITRANNSLIAGIAADVDLDLSELFDFTGFTFDSEFIDSITAEKDPNEPEKTTEDKVLDVLNKVRFGLDVTVEGEETENEVLVRKEYANLGVHFAENTGYVTLNENGDDAVMRAAVSVDTINALLDALPEAAEEVTGEEVDEEATSSLFSFITESELVTDIKDGKYDGVLELLNSIQAVDGTIVVDINLAPLGFGDNANVVLTLDSSLEANHHVLNVEINNAKIGENAYLDATLATKDFSEAGINRVLAHKDEYDQINHLKSVYDQVSAIMDSKQAGFKVTGSVKDAQGVGLDINGWGQFDYGTKYGFGSLTFDQYALNNKNQVTKKMTHLVNIDVDNRTYLDENAEVKVENPNRNAYFTYGPNQGIKGYLTVDSMSDILDVFSTFIKEQADNPRFSKFIKPLMETLGMDYFGNVIEDKNYIKFASSEVIKEIKEYDNGAYVNIRINGELFSLTEDIQIHLNYDGIGENRTLKSLELPSLAYKEQTISLKVEIQDFDANKSTPIDFSNTNSFLDFSTLKMLLDFGLNTTLQGYYSLSAAVNVKIGSLLTALNINLLGYVQVNGKNTKVYIVCNELDKNALITNDSVSCTTKSELIFEPDPSASGNDIGGYFHILRTEKHTSIFNRKTEKYYYRSSSKNFVDSEHHAANLLRYLLTDFLNVYETEVGWIVDAIEDGNNDESNINYEQLLTGDKFKYTSSNGGLNHKWNIGIDLKALTGVSALGALNITLNAQQANSEAKGYLSSLHADMKIASIFSISADITLANSGSTAQTWTSANESAYQAILAIFEGIKSNSTKYNTFMNSYYNQPTKHYSL